VLCVWLPGRYLVAQAYQVQPLEQRDYGMLRCITGTPAAPALRILDAVYVEDLQLAPAWCQSPPLARHFGEINLRGTHRDHLDLRELFEARYQLILAKPELLQEGQRSIRRGVDYVPLARYPDYGAQLVSLAGTPELSEQWLRGKRLGLIDDPNSVSAFQIPQAALKNNGLEAVPEIVYFRTYRQLYGALFDGRVDVIPALLFDEGPDSALQLPPGLVLEETIPGPSWYLHSELLDTPVHCDLLAALANLAIVAQVDFFRHFSVVRPCHVR
tara:strand:+ start:6337 stop:7149 length:813 start_codon:yes stop_codon:yes gene_type:complete